MVDKIKTALQIFLSALSLGLYGCDSMYYSLLPYSRDIKYLSKERIYKTNVEQEKFDTLQNRFLKVWQDTNNCYVHRRPCPRCPRDIEWSYPKEIRISNILHSADFDTLLFLVTWYSVKEFRGVKYDQTVSMPLVAVDSNKRLVFKCSRPIYSIIAKGNQIDLLEKDLKRLIIKGAYFDKLKKPDPTFWHRLLSDNDIWFTDRKDNQIKGERLLGKY